MLTLVIVGLLSAAAGAAAGYGFRGSIRSDIGKVVAAVKAEETKLVTSATTELKKL